MAGVKRPQRPKRQGLLFTSSSQKRRQDDQIDPTPSKRTKSGEPAIEVGSVTTNLNNAATTVAAIATTTLRSTNFLILSDTHGKSELPQTPNLPIDVVLHCGDFSECGQLEDYRKTIALLTAISAPLKLVIAGNHDLTLDEKFWSQHATKSGAGLHNQARELWGGKEARDTGIVFLEDGLHEFELENGSKLRLYSSSATPNISEVPEWAFGHPTRDDIYNPLGQGISYGSCATSSNSEIKDAAEIDIIMTHGPARYRLDRSSQGGESIGCPHLFRALRRSKPALHVFGHVHEGYGAEVVTWAVGMKGEMPEDDDSDDGIKQITKVKGTENEGVRQMKGSKFQEGRTTFVNAALMGEGGELENLPWFVQMDLKKAE